MTNSTNLRHKHYVDDRLQRQLIIGLAMLQVTLVCAAFLWLYLGLDRLIAEKLYQIHPASDRSALDQLLLLILPALTGMVAIDVVALSIADRFWNAHITRVIESFTYHVSAIANLDFRPLPSMASDHELIVRASAWLATERELWLRLKALAEDLGASPKPNNQSNTIKRITLLLEQHHR